MEKRNVNKKLVTTLFVVIAVLGHGLLAQAGNLEPSAGPGSTMKTLDEVEPRIPIPGSSLTSPAGVFTITQSGSYYLIGNRYSSGDGIVVNADNVTIDLMGYQLIGPGSVSYNGIYMNGRSNIEIRNGTVRAFNNGVYEAEKNNGKSHRVLGVRAVSNMAGGIYLKGSGHLIKDCTAIENGSYGINCGNKSTITGNTIHSNTGYGLYVNEGNIVIENSIDSNVVGIYVYGSNSRIEKNSIKSNTVRGLHVNDNKNIIADNIVIGNNDNYDIAANNQLNILLCEVPETIDWPAMVTLAGTLTVTATDQHAISVNADDVTIDLGGHSLIGPDSGIGHGIYMDGRSNIEIRNGTVRDFHIGIAEGNSLGKEHRVINVRSVSNVQNGIYLMGYSHLVKDCTVSDNGNPVIGGTVHGIFVINSSKVIGNTVYNNGNLAGLDVIAISANYGSLVTGNTVEKNGKSAGGDVYGISVGLGCTVAGNAVYNNGESATGEVRGINANIGSTVIGNTAYYNGYLAIGTVYGIYLAGNSLVDQNTAFLNSGTNMYDYGSSCTFGTNYAP